MMTHFGKSPPKDLFAQVCKLCLPSRAQEKMVYNFIDYPSHSNMELMKQSKQVCQFWNMFLAWALIAAFFSTYCLSAKFNCEDCVEYIVIGCHKFVTPAI